MTPLQKVINKKDKLIKPVWLMRQAGRYLPEFREIRKNSPNFIKLCLSPKKVKNITLQPIKRFNFDAAIIFSDIIMVPYGLDQSVEFKKNFGPSLGSIDLNHIKKYSKKNFKKKLEPIYQSINLVSKDELINKKDLIGFIGGPWTLLIYMLNKNSPKKKLKKILTDKPLVLDMIKYINRFLEQHIKYQVENGADIIQIFDSWAGLVKERDLDDFVYNPTKKLVKFTKSINRPCICFPRNIKNYYNYTKIVKPDVISIDYITNPEKIATNINIPVQGGMDPRVLLTSKKNIERTAKHYLNIFKNHPYIFNLGHGVLPQTDPNMVDYLTRIIRKFNEKSSKN